MSSRPAEVTNSNMPASSTRRRLVARLNWAEVKHTRAGTDCRPSRSDAQHDVTTPSVSGTHFSYDLDDRLASTSAGGTTLTYSYDGDGKRLSESDGTNTTRFLWDANQPLPQLAIERNSAGTLLRRYHHGLDLVSMRNGAGADFYHHPDGLGSAANLTDATGATQWSYEYEPYGAERVATPAPGAPVNRIRYTGEYLDTDTGLYHLRARQYDPLTGRFLTTDPVAADVSDPTWPRTSTRTHDPACSPIRAA